MDMQMSWLRPGEVFKMSSLGRESDYSGKSFLPGHVQPLAMGFRPSTPFPHQSGRPLKGCEISSSLLTVRLRVFPASSVAKFPLRPPYGQPYLLMFLCCVRVPQCVCEGVMLNRLYRGVYLIDTWQVLSNAKV